ncbi:MULTISPECIES: hypothetical protein [Photorhabdus]|uniref:Uncharacterized protein n=1 Tax=Photorhabdus luminescens TaxID=29488 RepID=A0A1G5RBC5_PHOLU|nr:hypothetical protein [Photorhabdus luminescens]SCZ70589.1 hypothetical protein SAMN02982990_03532 [Photorhabdus luminescens]
MMSEQRETWVTADTKQWLIAGLKRNFRRGLIVMPMMGCMLLVAAVGLEHPSQFNALQHWMYMTRYGWLTWRLVMYSVIACFMWQLWRSPLPLTQKAALKRIALISLGFVGCCEYAMFFVSGEQS